MATSPVNIFSQSASHGNDVWSSTLGHVILPVDTALLTLSAPAQTELHAVTLVGTGNVITLSAPAQTELHAVTLVGTGNVITLSAPAQSQVMETTLTATANVITLSAPIAVLSQDILLVATANIITLSAPAQSQLVEKTLAAGQNAITLTAATAIIPVLIATTNTISLSNGNPVFLIGVQNKGNTAKWSEAFTEVTMWTVNGSSGATITGDQTTAPDGTTTADLLKEDTSGVFHSAASWGTINVSQDRTWVNFSVHVKAKELQFVALTIYDNISLNNALFAGFYLGGAGQLIDAYTGLAVDDYYFDRSTAGPHHKQIDALANGWYRIELGGYLEKGFSTGVNVEIYTGNPPVGVPVSMDAEQYFDYTGDGTSGLYIWGAQFEEFSSKSIYTKTTSTTIANTIFTFGGVTIAATAPVAYLDPLQFTPSANVITLSAPTVPSLALTMPVTTNLITLTAPTADIVAGAGGTTLDATANTITLSAPTVPAVNLTMPQTVNTITLSAPAQSQLIETTVVATTNTITLSAPAQSQSMATTITATANVITLSAPDIPAVALTMPVTTNIVTLSAPVQSQLVNIDRAAGQNTLTVSAPGASLIADSVLAVIANVVTVSAPNIAGMHLVHVLQTNTITITPPAPDVTVTFNSTLTTGTAIITVRAPILTVQPQYGGDTIYRETARLNFTQHETMKV